jgi:hypothetical protein
MSDEGPPRSGRDGVLWRAVRRLAVLSDSSLRGDSPARYAIWAGKLGAFLASNAYWDGSDWQRYDTAQPAAALVPDPSGKLQLRTAAAGANPIGWSSSDLAWTALPSFAANWSDFGAGVPTAGYMKDATGRVWLKGGVKKAAALALPDTITGATPLPVGYRPANVHDTLCGCRAPDGWALVRVDTGGNVILLAGGTITLTWLEPVSFDPAT